MRAPRPPHWDPPTRGSEQPEPKLLAVTLLLVVTIVFALLSAVALLAAVSAFRSRRWGGGLVGTLVGLLLLAVTALAAAISIGTQGYRALTHEVVAATITTERSAEKEFRAIVRFPDNRLAIFNLAGDQFYVDAHILKWHPIANVLGVHTGYELDRISGRYASLEDERTQPRTIFSLSETKMLNFFDVARRFGFLRPLVDAEYGSATFAPTAARAEYEVRVSTSGLLLRRIQEGRDR